MLDEFCVLHPHIQNGGFGSVRTLLYGITRQVRNHPQHDLKLLCFFQMPRGKKLAWSPRKMRLAVEEVKAGSKLRKTAFQFGIPVMSLYDHVKKGPEFKPRLGGKPVFTTKQEAEIRDHLIKLSNTHLTHRRKRLEWTGSMAS